MNEFKYGTELILTIKNDSPYDLDTFNDGLKALSHLYSNFTNKKSKLSIKEVKKSSIYFSFQDLELLSLLSDGVNRMAIVNDILQFGFFLKIGFDYIKKKIIIDPKELQGIKSNIKSAKFGFKEIGSSEITNPKSVAQYDTKYRGSEEDIEEDLKDIKKILKLAIDNVSKVEIDLKNIETNTIEENYSFSFDATESKKMIEKIDEVIGEKKEQHKIIGLKSERALSFSQRAYRLSFYIITMFSTIWVALPWIGLFLYYYYSEGVVSEILVIGSISISFLASAMLVFSLILLITRNTRHEENL